ncbi:hypothetical protein CCAX7_51680 [Capsulimonas corticalis]|uniref:Uncharacterized protein n=1 Tax=Capsulimonas corticalis TaxID=2219043 RepID=A0A402CP99_9BACT|nr:hypothetical protein [Capsulimonas corticalis]BDI33117.1 hypothetical protein CCAX7_51680 [Capsulimonas corticalis]
MINNVAPFQHLAPRRFGWRGSLLTVAGAGAALLAISPAFTGNAVAQRGLLAAVLTLLLVVLTRMAPLTGMVATMGYLVLMGWVRRALTPYFDWVETDPLLLVAPGVAIVFGGSAMWRTRGRAVSKMTKFVFLLLSLMTIEIFNPLQGGIEVGVVGALFYIVPIFWYFVGRDLLDLNRLSSYLQTFAWMTVGVAAYGFYQSSFGYSDAEADWLRTTHYSWALTPGMQRAFSTLPSFAEYAHVIAAGSILLFVGLLFKKRIGLILVPVMLYGMFMASSRGALITLLGAMCILWAVMAKDRKSWFFRGGIALVVATLGLVFTMTRVQESTANVDPSTSTTSALVKHQTDGILNPTDGSKSTVGVHMNLAAGGFLKGFTTPIGYGLGSTTLASTKFSNEGNNSEIDITNVFTALGFVGGFLYLAFLILSFALAIKMWHKTRIPVLLSVLAILIVYLGQWLIGGEYTTSMIVWTCLGALDRSQRKVIV